MPRVKVLYHASGKKMTTLKGNPRKYNGKLYTTGVEGPASRKGTAEFYAKQYGNQKQNHGRAYIHQVEHRGFHRDDVGPNPTTKKVKSSRRWHPEPKGRPAEFVSKEAKPVIGGRWVRTDKHKFGTTHPHTSIQSRRMPHAGPSRKSRYKGV